MKRFSPKIEIINHFDNLINRIDIEIDSSIEKYNDQQLLGEILQSSENNRLEFKDRLLYFDVKFFDTIDSSKPNLESWPESTKVVDYLKQIRMKTIEELKNAQEEAIEYYKLNSQRFKSELTNEKRIEELKSELFSDKFIFQVNFEQSGWPFNVFTFITNFYISQSHIDSLENLINDQENDEEEPFDEDIIFDDKMVLIGLLYKCFIENLLNFPNHMIHVRKEDILNIKSIGFYYQYSGVNLTSSSRIDLSKLVDLYLLEQKDPYWRDSIEYNIEGLSSLKSLHLGAYRSEFDISITNLPSLTNLFLSFYGTIDQDNVTRVFDQVPYIQELHLAGNLCYFNLDSFVNLRVLSLYNFINADFNLKLFENLCNQLEVINICIDNIEDEILFELFDGYNFPYLVDFSLRSYFIKSLTKEFMNGFSTLRQLNINQCEIEIIEHDSFSNVQQLTSLNLSNNRIELIEKNAFSNLKNLQTLDLSDNVLTNFDRNFIGLRESVEVKLENDNFLNFTFS